MERLKGLPVIRFMRADDCYQLADIDKKVTGRSRLGYWKFKAELAEKESSTVALVAEVEEKIVGFIIGDVSGWEYMVPESVGWINTIIVTPEYQRRGIGEMLVNEMVEHMKKSGIRSIYTFIYWRDFDLLRFFDSIGFNKGEMINLRLDVV